MKHDLMHVKELLEERTAFYNRPAFIDSDPVQVPHSFTGARDIEISAFFTATLAWGQRKTIISKSFQLMGLMGNRPYEFVCSLTPEKEKKLAFFCHRTFNGADTIYFIRSLRYILHHFESLQNLFEGLYLENQNIRDTLIQFRKIFFAPASPTRSGKHVADINHGASGKRLNMFLRWMIRRDNKGVDFGLWRKIPSSSLYIPLDVHSGTVARELGLLKRKQNDWQAVEELTAVLRTFDPEDPVKYDYALFGMGAHDDLVIW
jgi:uncharacterized protein (TIGR02757 family)